MSDPRRRFLGALAVAVSTVALAGCGGDGRELRARVIGTVTYRGKPLAGAAISFLPETVGWRSGIGKTDAEGKFVLGSYDPDDGVPVGKCKVAISLRGPPKKLPKGAGEAFNDMIMDSGDPVIPLKYFNPETSKLTAEVIAGKTNEFTFDLVD